MIGLPALLFFLMLPVLGGFIIRRSWRRFRARFEELRLAPLLDYRSARQAVSDGREFRFFGGFESVTDDKTLWVRNELCTAAIDIKDAHIYLLPLESGARDVDASPAKIGWDQVSALSEGAGVFIGGQVKFYGGTVRFVSSKNKPLLIILYDGSERSMLTRTVQVGRQKNEFWNPLTPVSLAAGIFVELFLALFYVYRPLYSLAFTAAMIAASIPLLPLLPPGVFFTTLYRNLWERGRYLRACRDLVRLPLRHLPLDAESGLLPDGSAYGYVPLASSPPPEASFVPSLPPEAETKKLVKSDGTARWYGALGSGFPRMPKDPTAVFAIIDGDPLSLAKRYVLKARSYELAAGLVFCLGLTINAILGVALIRLIK